MAGKAFPLNYSIEDFSGGWDNVSKPSTLSARHFSDLKNWNITRHKGLEKRGGMDKLYATTAGSATDVKQLYEYKAPNDTDYVLVNISTKVRSYYNAQWNDLKTGLTAGKKCDFVTHRGLCYGVNGVDDNFKLYNTTSYGVGIAKPESNPTVAATATGTDALTSTHPTANADVTGKLRSTASETLLGQSFILDTGVDLSKVVLKLRKVGSPTGNLKVEIHT